MKPFILFALASLAFPSTLCPSVSRADDTPTDDAKASGIETVRFSIHGMVTKRCPALVKQAVSRIDGVRRVEASLETKSAEVDYDASKTSAKAIQAVIKDQVGFDARVAD